MCNLTTLARIAALLILSGAASAQSGGPTMALAQGFSVDWSTAPFLPGFSEGSVILNNTDFDYIPPVPGVAPGAPDFGLLTSMWPAGLDIDALSIGMDWVLSNAGGFVSIPPGNWGVLTYSVRYSSVGLPGSVIADEVAGPDGAGADIFAYVLPGSALPPEIVGIPFRAQDSTEIKVPPGPFGPEIDAHDLFVGLIYNDNPQLGAMLPPPTVFFSVTDATKGILPVAWGPMSGATVFRTTWVPGSYSWTTPTVYLTPAALGLFMTEDLDGLALDLAHGRVLLSTDPVFPPPLPILPRNAVLYSTLFSGMNTTYKLASGSPVSTALGLGSADDADGLCMLDPGTNVTPTQQRIDRMIGTPRNALNLGVPTTLQMSVARHGTSINQEHFRTLMTGWPAPGPFSPGFAIVGVTIGQPAVGPWVTLPGFHFRPGGPYAIFQGHPEVQDWQIPFGFSLSGIPMTFLWGALSGAGGVALSHPATITL